jgi:hypothetical protein
LWLARPKDFSFLGQNLEIVFLHFSANNGARRRTFSKKGQSGQTLMATPLVVTMMMMMSSWPNR